MAFKRGMEVELTSPSLKPGASTPQAHPMHVGFPWCPLGRPWWTGVSPKVSPPYAACHMLSGIGSGATGADMCYNLWLQNNEKKTSIIMGWKIRFQLLVIIDTPFLQNIVSSVWVFRVSDVMFIIVMTEPIHFVACHPRWPSDFSIIIVFPNILDLLIIFSK